MAAGKRGGGECIGDSGGEIGRREASAQALLRRWLGELDRTPLRGYQVRRRGEVPFVNGDAKRRVMMFTAAPYQHLDAGEMYKHHGSDADLVAVAHVERVDAGEVRERRVGDADLVTVSHVERPDAAQVHKVGIDDILSIRYVADACARVGGAPSGEGADDASAEVGMSIRVERHHKVMVVT